MKIAKVTGGETHRQDLHGWGLGPVELAGRDSILVNQSGL